MTRIIEALSDISHAYDALFVDLWGCVHNGVKALPEAVAALQTYRDQWPGLPSEPEARWFAERTALLLTASLLLRHAPPAVADGFIATRLTGDSGRVPGSVRGLDTEALLARLG